MSWKLLPLTAAATALCLAGPAAARGAHRSIEVRDAWSRPAAAGATGAGFMTLVNHGHAADALVAAESPEAKRVEIHQSRMTGGVMSMSRLETLPIPAGGTVRLAPGGTHLMLIGLAHATKPGERIRATLRFASGETLATDLVVRTGQPMADMPGMVH